MADSGGEARLFVLAGPDLGRSYPLGARTVLGRSDECEVVLRDRSISRKHAVLVHEGGRWVLEDLGSTNGIAKDGKRAARIELADGDEFRLGDLPLRLRLGAAAPPVAGSDIEFETGPARASPAAARPAAPAAAGGRAPAAKEAREAAEVHVEDEVEIEIEGPDQPGARTTASAAPFAPAPPRARRRTGLFAGDLSQQPLWLRTLLVLVLLALCAGLAFGAFRAVAMLRAGT